MKRPSLSIVLPCYNPPKNWSENILVELAWLTETLPEETIHLFVINDGTAEEALRNNGLIDKPNISFYNRVENRGKGFTLREGVANTKSQKIIYTDIDFPYQRENLLSIFRALDNCDVAIGVRSDDYYRNMPPIRVWVSKSLRFFIRLFLRIPTDDTQCGLKGFNLKGKQAFLATTIDRYLFDLEFIFVAARKNLVISKIPVELKEGIVLSKLNMSILWRESINFIKVFVRSIIN